MTALAPVATRRSFDIDVDSAGIPLLPGFRLEIWVNRPDATGEIHNNHMADGKTLQISSLVSDHVDGIYFTGRLVSLEEHFGHEPKETFTEVTGFFRFRGDISQHRIEMPVV